MNDRSDAFFKEAAKKLTEAKNELFKPAEDFVSYSVCKNSQFAIENYLKGYLISNNVKIEGNETIESLFNKCVSIDEKLQ
jgi:HEPN domain-containing protein